MTTSDSHNINSKSVVVKTDKVDRIEAVNEAFIVSRGWLAEANAFGPTRSAMLAFVTAFGLAGGVFGAIGLGLAVIRAIAWWAWVVAL